MSEYKNSSAQLELDLGLSLEKEKKKERTSNKLKKEEYILYSKTIPSKLDIQFSPLETHPASETAGALFSLPP